MGLMPYAPQHSNSPAFASGCLRWRWSCGGLEACSSRPRQGAACRKSILAAGASADGSANPAGGTARPPVEGNTGRTRGFFCGEGTHEHRGGGFEEGPRGGGTQCAQCTGKTVSGMKTTAGDGERGHKGRAVLALPWRRQSDRIVL
ncbi:hypothetical protein DPMN_076827 [Dreissena polymorpha]|uniref:Uncharacterized protein n=1 Tax=Dreissena polymorpha TaxID=45954 RepID=A0A9D3YNT1_DREPO|nr:hypothetical protein DPMN_076827 [Dreissena polymorpha]